MSATKWSIDPTHSQIGFKVKHMMFTNVSGKFENFEGSFSTEGDEFENAQASFTAQTDSISTGNTDRDNHLKSPDFFDAAQFPTVNFESTSFTKQSGQDYQLTGNLSLHGVTKEITLAVEFGGLQKDPWGNTKAGLSATGKINRKDWNLNWNAALETGGVLVSEEVKFEIELQLLKQ